MKTITSISDYFEWIHEIKKDKLINAFSCYRGQSDKDWKLTCSLQRRGMVGSESKLIKTLKAQYADEFPDTLSSFSLLAKAQHYGMPTRLIDFTLNPLVALFFACNENTDKDGKVIAFVEKPASDPSKTIDEVCSYWKNDILSSITIYDSFDDEKNSYSHYYRITNLYLDKLFKIPDYISARERNQQSVFLVCINEILDSENNPLSLNAYFNHYVSKDHFPKMLKDYRYSQTSIKEIDTQSNRFHTIEIKAEDKLKILDDLKLVGISKGFIFPELDKKIEDLVDQIDRY